MGGALVGRDGIGSVGVGADSYVGDGGGGGADRTDHASRIGDGAAAVVARGRDLRTTGERRVNEGRRHFPRRFGGGPEAGYRTEWADGGGVGQQRSDDQEVLPQGRSDRTASGECNDEADHRVVTGRV